MDIRNWLSVNKIERIETVKLDDNMLKDKEEGQIDNEIPIKRRFNVVKNVKIDETRSKTFSARHESYLKETYQNEDGYRVDTPKDSVVTRTMNLDKLEEPVRLEFRSDIDIMKCERVNKQKR